MLKKIAILAMVVLFSMSLFSLTACQSVGEATGTAVREVKQAPRDFKEGYKEGRSPDETSQEKTD